VLFSFEFKYVTIIFKLKYLSATYKPLKVKKRSNANLRITKDYNYKEIKKKKMKAF